MFFSTINEVMDGYDLNMTISKKNGVISVMVIPKPTNQKVDLSEVPPFTVSGTAKELDEGFVEAMSQAGRATTGVVSSISQFTELLNKEKESKVKSAKVKKDKGGKKAATNPKPVVKKPARKAEKREATSKETPAAAGKDDPLFKDI